VSSHIPHFPPSRIITIKRVRNKLPS
jgi:hypothetical protein